ncbi:hypothetical protein D3C73_1021150 [compost metagenome]
MPLAVVQFCPKSRADICASSYSHQFATHGPLGELAGILSDTCRVRGEEEFWKSHRFYVPALRAKAEVQARAMWKTQGSPHGKPVCCNSMSTVCGRSPEKPRTLFRRSHQPLRGRMARVGASVGAPQQSGRPTHARQIAQKPCSSTHNASILCTPRGNFWTFQCVNYWERCIA